MSSPQSTIKERRAAALVLALRLADRGRRGSCAIGPLEVEEAIQQASYDYAACDGSPSWYLRSLAAVASMPDPDPRADEFVSYASRAAARAKVARHGQREVADRAVQAIRAMIPPSLTAELHRAISLRGCSVAPVERGYCRMVLGRVVVDTSVRVALEADRAYRVALSQLWEEA